MPKDCPKQRRALVAPHPHSVSLSLAILSELLNGLKNSKKKRMKMKLYNLFKGRSCHSCGKQNVKEIHYNIFAFTARSAVQRDRQTDGRNP